MVVQANDLRDLMERAVTLGYVIRADQDVLGRLELARRRSARLHQAMVEAEQDRTAAEAKVRRQLAELEQVRAVRQDAEHQLDARVARLAGAAAALRRRSAELRRLIHQEELARQRAAQAGGGGRSGSGRRCDLSGTTAAERWIILRESSGDPTATTRPRPPLGSASSCSATASCTWATTTPPPTAAASCGRSGPMSATATAPPPTKAFWQTNGWY